MPNINTSTLRLIYFDIPGKAEAIRLCAAVAGVPLEDVRVTREEFAEKMEEVQRLLTAEEEPEVDLGVLGDIAALVGVRKFPARIKCATLAWHALDDALKGEGN